MDPASPYPLHTVRWILRSIASLFLFLSFCLYLADGVACVNNVNEYNNSYYDSYYDDGYTVDAVMVCWTDSLFGDLRPVLIVRTSISLSIDKSQMTEFRIEALLDT
jgi:hypothetical protein